MAGTHATYEAPGISSRATLPALAAAIAEWFPELEGRSIAVSEAEVTPENVPTLPLVMVALGKETSTHSARSNGQIPIVEDILVQFWQRTEKYRRADGSESPFWAYYDYSAIRDKLLANVIGWTSPVGWKLAYRSLDIESDHLAVVLTFRFDHAFEWCEDRATVDECGKPLECLSPKIKVRMPPKPGGFGGVTPVEDPCADVGQTVAFPAD